MLKRWQHFAWELKKANEHPKPHNPTPAAIYLHSRGIMGFHRMVQRIRWFLCWFICTQAYISLQMVLFTCLVLFIWQWFMRDAIKHTLKHKIGMPPSWDTTTGTSQHAGGGKCTFIFPCANSESPKSLFAQWFCGGRSHMLPLFLALAFKWGAVLEPKEAFSDHKRAILFLLEFVLVLTWLLLAATGCQRESTKAMCPYEIAATDWVSLISKPLH